MLLTDYKNTTDASEVSDWHCIIINVLIFVNFRVKKL
jgi:hypothetical protein